MEISHLCAKRSLPFFPELVSCIPLGVRERVLVQWSDLVNFRRGSCLPRVFYLSHPFRRQPPRRVFRLGVVAHHLQITSRLDSHLCHILFSWRSCSSVCRTYTASSALGECDLFPTGFLRCRCLAGAWVYRPNKPALGIVSIPRVDCGCFGPSEVLIGAVRFGPGET